MFHRGISSLSRRSFHTTALLSSAQTATKRININDILQQYRNNDKISVITAHDYISGKIASDAGADIILVGDSLAMVALGYEDTNEIPFDEFLYHCRAVSRGVDRSFILADLPFGTYESSSSKAIETCVQLISKGRCNAVKIEGGVEIAPTIKELTKMGIPVCGHVGLTPQRINALGGFKVQGKTTQSADKLLKDVFAIQEAGAFSMVIEAVPYKLGQYVTESLEIPTIGIGAGPHTSGQVLVQADLLGMTNGHVPKFVKRYMNGYDLSVDAVKTYVNDVKTQQFPIIDQHTYKIKDQVFDEFAQKHMKLDE